MRPSRCPSVRATFGRRSGPITISATTAMSMSSEKPMSNMLRLCCFLPHFRVDGLTRGGGDLGLHALVFLGLHAVLEAFHGAAEVGAEIAQFLGAEDQDDDY